VARSLHAINRNSEVLIPSGWMVGREINEHRPKQSYLEARKTAFNY
jgi:hypothetical protein